MTYEPIDSKIDLPELELEVLSFWKEDRIFEKRVESQKERTPWSFIDGPITANNPMGVHHAWGRTYKDLWARYMFMRGNKVRNQNGFDCQGLWIEVEVERDLGFKSKRDIEKYGIAEFVKRCKQRVLEYAAVQTEQSIRLGMWTDWNDPEELRKLEKAMENPMGETTYVGTYGPVTGTAEELVGRLGSREMGGSYFTFSDENNYMIWAVLKELHQRGWIYKGFDSMPWCPRCSTGISQHEIVTEGYKELTHPSVYLKFPLRQREGSLLIWTTTPWTLTSNVAVAVHPDLDYVKVEHEREIFYLSKGSLPGVFPKGRFEVLNEFKGAEMEGWGYNGPYDELELPRSLGAPEVHTVIFWEEVGEAEGTGLVHIAPGAGKEDFELGVEYGLPVVAPLDEFGVFIDGLGWLSGTHVYDSAEPIFEDLRRKGLIFRTEDYTHRYPVCWRCDSELVFRHVDEWFIRMGEVLDKPLEEVTEEEKERNLRYQIMDSACQTRWIPEFGLARELDWLRNMNDWMISKKRYSGLALPIWVCSDCGWFDVIGGKDELRERAVEGWEVFKGHSPHRPYIDAVKVRCDKCGGVASRILDVGNPWLDAGIVAFSTLDYRTDRKYWERWFPADFITEEYIGQFRNWFYSMLAMSTILERRTPFEVCLGHGTVLAEDGREMHKSWGNAIWFDDAAETMGADVMRWMFCSTKPENDILFGYRGAGEAKRLFFMPLLNVYQFFSIYANLDGWTPEQEPENLSDLDRWVLSKLNSLVVKVTESLDNFDVYSPTREIERFVDDLSKWYVRRSRRRFWKSEADDDKKAAYSTLYTCLKTLATLMAPITPFITEAMYRKLVRAVEPEAPESIHLLRWPEADTDLIDVELMERMDLVTRISSLGRAARNGSGIKLRQPLQEAVVVAEVETLRMLEGIDWLVEEELNVKEVKLSQDRGDLYRYLVKPMNSELGRKHGRLLPKVVEALKSFGQEDVARLLRGESVELEVKGVRLEVQPDEVEVVFLPVEPYSVMEEPELMVGVRVELTEELKREGLSRDIVRRIQALRKEADFEIDDEIDTYFSGDPEVEEVFKVEGEYISTETLSRTLSRGKPPKGAYTGEFDIDGKKLRLGLIQV
ncbi:MAG: isoleucine--tRNA ligase [Candidatus Bathyarchaeota archaeon]|nr:MAG: isoleucine--tRNA ligase [Candidatus Bathyarchaeota archaeon]